MLNLKKLMSIRAQKELIARKQAKSNTQNKK